MEPDNQLISAVTASLEATIQKLEGRTEDRSLREQLGRLLKSLTKAINKKVLRRRQLAVTSIPPGGVYELFKIISGSTQAHRAWDIQPDERKNVPEHLERSLEMYIDGIKGGRQNEAYVRVKINAILLTTLYTVKNDPSYQRLEPNMDYSKIHFQFETSLKLLWLDLDNESVVVSGAADYTLWHGRAFDVQETNLLVVEAKNAKGNGREQCLAYMAMLLYSRRGTGRSARTIWGINTNSNDWEFIRLNPDLTFSTRKYSVEEGQFKDIISTLARIFADTAVLSPVVSLASNEDSRKRSFEDVGK